MRGVDREEVKRFLGYYQTEPDRDNVWTHGVHLLVQAGYKPYIWFAKRERREECINHCAERLAEWLRRQREN